MKNKFMFIYTDDVGVSVLILFIDYCHKKAYYTYIGNYNTVISSHNEKIIVKLADGIFHRYFIPIINRVWMGFYASVHSNCALPPAPRPAPPGNCGAFVRLGGPGGVAFANFARPGGRALANLRGIPRAFDTHVVYISETWRIPEVKISALWGIG